MWARMLHTLGACLAQAEQPVQAAVNFTEVRTSSSKRPTVKSHHR